jgi:sterol 3beta-glucosyltransferase
MKLVLSARGSRGDVHPVVEIAAELRRRGHDVTLCVPALFRDFAGRRGLEPLLYREDSETVMRGMGSGWGASGEAIRWFARNVEEQMAVLLPVTRGADALVTTVNEVAAQSVAEYRGIRHLRVAYCPVIPGDQPPPLLPWTGLPAAVNRAGWRILNMGMSLLLGRFLDEKRRALGLGPIGEFGRYVAARSHTILALNAELAPPSPEWVFPYSYAGYCYGDGGEPFEPGLRRFLEAGPPPVVVGFGSVIMKDPARLTRRLLAAARIAGCRLVLSSGWTGLGRRDLPGDVYLAGDLPHGAVLPHVAGIVHHGGSGTTHTAARAGIPQMVMPQIADQFYWGSRVRALGLGPEPLPPSRATVGALAKGFMELRENVDHASAALAMSGKMRGENGVAAAADIILSAGR